MDGINPASLLIRLSRCTSPKKPNSSPRAKGKSSMVPFVSYSLFATSSFGQSCQNKQEQASYISLQFHPAE
ncbi:hypothetical protein CI102_15120 [Trichoderma harzianum]|nr:hypothetical protein CI102_15120 [Trichoderma harzianum]